MSNTSFSGLTSTDVLPVLLDDLMHGRGEEVGTRDGRRAKEMCHIGIRLMEPWKRELLLPDRKHHLAAQVAETMWVLAGRNDIEFLSHYLPRAADFSDDGVTWRGGYGPRLRGNGFSKVDQVAHVVEMLRKNPLSRQAVIAIYNADLDTLPGKDIPCNDFIQFTSRLGFLEMHVYIRSNDAIWGWSGINAFEWSALQEIVAGLLGIQVGALHFSVGSFHVYDTHWEKASKIAQAGGPMGKGIADSPRFSLPDNGDRSLLVFDAIVEEWFAIEEAIREGKDMTDHIINFPEPMLQSWLRVIAWWWTGDYGHLDELPRLRASASLSVQPNPKRNSDHATGMALDINARPKNAQDFVKFVDDLHREKAKAYGDSWKKRGEVFSIMPNVARKVDRLGRPDIDGENATDTAIDLMVYLIKYRLWLSDEGVAPLPLNLPHTDKWADNLDVFTVFLKRLHDKSRVVYPIATYEAVLNNDFNDLLSLVDEKYPKRYMKADIMLDAAVGLAISRYQQS